MTKVNCSHAAHTLRKTNFFSLLQASPFCAYVAFFAGYRLLSLYKINLFIS